MGNALKYLLFIVLFALLGFTREFIFVNINSHLYNLYYQRQEHTLPYSMLFLLNYDYKTIYFSKYGLTVAYFLGYLMTSYFSVKIICNTKSFSRWIIYIYALLILCSSIIMLYNYLFNHQYNGEEYTLSRWIMGIAQSPLVAFFMIASHTLYNKFNIDKTL